MKNILKHYRAYFMIKRSGLFDDKYYLATYEDIRKADINPIYHYLKYGAQEGRNPSIKFNTLDYLNNKDIHESNINPLVHFILHGYEEGRIPDYDGPIPYQKKRVARSKFKLPKKIIFQAFSAATMLLKKPSLLVKFFVLIKKQGFQDTIEMLKIRLGNGYYEPSLKYKTRNMQEYLHSLNEKKFNPLVTVIVPNYNHSKFLKHRIDSILSQTYKNFELILLDDCSTDNSREILDAYAAENTDKIRTLYNDKNAGNVFKQWRKGVEQAHGELIWICESDDFCKDDFLEKVITHFRNPAVSIAFGRIQFSNSNGKYQEGLDLYREGAEPGIWNAPTVRPANKWFCNAFGVNNVIANVGGCVFKKQKIALSVWEQAERYKILGDWFLYLHISAGGLIAYEPTAIAFFRQHGENTSVSAFATAKYYTEHFELISAMKSKWDVPDNTVSLFYQKISAQYAHFNCIKTLGPLDQLVQLESLKSKNREYKHILIGMLSFTPGGGELFPINLANALIELPNTIVSLFVLDMSNIQQDMYDLVDKRIQIYDSKFVTAYGVNEFIIDAGIDAINSHMVSVDAFFMLNNKINVPFFPTLHGSYEACNVSQDAIEKISEGVTHWIYTANRNLEALSFLDLPEYKFTKLSNAMPIDDRPFPQTREELGISKDDVVFTLVARGIKRKGWRAAIEAFLKLEHEFQDIHLLLCGDGDETQKLKEKYSAHPKITFLGYQSNIHGLYRLSDCAIVPTRFEGESYPLCIIQALQVGLPVISVDVGEISSMLIDDKGNRAGLVLENVRDTKLFITKLYEAMLLLLDGRERLLLSECAKKIAVDYSISLLARKYRDVFFKKKLYLHIGQPKTGTSAIQNFIVVNSSILKDEHDLYYPNFGRWKDGSHHEIAFSLRDTPFYPVKTYEEQINYLLQLKKEIQNSICNRILLSSECFSVWDSKAFKEVFNQDFEIYIICYLRRRSDYVESIYKQNVRDLHFREKRTFSEFLEFYKNKLNYYDELVKWSALATKNNFIVREYSISSSLKFGIIGDFFNVFNIDIDKVCFVKDDKRANDSFAAEVVEFKRLLNIGDGFQDSKLISLLQNYSNSCEKMNFLSTEEAIKLELSFKDDDKKLSNNFDFKFTSTIPAQIDRKVFKEISAKEKSNIENFLFEKNYLQ